MAGLTVPYGAAWTVEMKEALWAASKETLLVAHWDAFWESSKVASKVGVLDNLRVVGTVP